MTNNEWTKQIQNIIRPTLGENGEFDPREFAGNYWDGVHKLAACADGVGSKTKLAFQMGKLDTIGIDLVAMNVNDLIADFAYPMFFLDYIGVNSLDKDQLCDILIGVAEGCKQAGCALIGGETAEIPTTYPPNDASLAGFAVGRSALETSEPQVHDVVIGYPSTGLHSNGFTLIHKLLDEGKLERTDELLKPTKIYTDLQEIFEIDGVNGFAHITGGGLLENIPRALYGNIMVEICPGLWKKHRHPIYDELEELVSHDTLYETFNMGIGFVAIVDAEICREIMAKTSHLSPIEIGMVCEWRGNYKQVELL